MNRLWLLTAITVVVSASLISGVEGQSTRHGTTQVITVHGRSLEGNLEGDLSDRQVYVYLPPSYQLNPTRRYPVVYLLHGFSATAALMFSDAPQSIKVPAGSDRAFADGSANEMIVVVPDAYTKYAGSYYSSSILTGDWETFIRRDLIDYVDKHFRTIPNRAARALAGHSMGGYGALRIGMKYPDVYSAIYAMSPCCLRTLDGGFDLSGTEHIATYEDFQHANFFAKAEMGLAVAWSPNLGSPPFFVDLPTKDGQVQPAVLAKWDANSPLAMVDQYIGNLRQLSAIGFDAGNRDLGNIADTVTVLDGTLTQYHVSHRFDIYSGTHTSGIAERWEKVVLPMLSAALGSTTAAPTRKTITH